MKKKLFFIAALILVGSAAVLILRASSPGNPAGGGRSQFVHQRGGRFFAGNKPFRFVGANVAVMYRDEDRERMPETIRQAARQVNSTAEQVDAANAGATLAQQRFDAEQRRFEVGLSTTFLVTQAQRDLLQAQVNLLQTTLDYQSSLVNFEAVQQAPPLTAGDTVGVRGGNVVLLPTPAPRGLFRPGVGSGFEN